jgi:pilus assembly protein Flp/PilA
MRFLRQFIASEDGPTAVEYAFMLALILMAVIAMVALVGSNTAALWNNSQQNLNKAGFGTAS